MQESIAQDEKVILKRLVDRVLRLRRGTPIRELRNSLGSNRHILDRLLDLGYLRREGDQYMPTHMALEQVDEDIRQIANRAVNAVLTALRDLYTTQDKNSFTFEEILIAVRQVDPALDENDVIPALSFATDFNFFGSWSGPSGESIKITNISLQEHILDFRSAEQERKRICEARQAVRARATAGLSGPISQVLVQASAPDFSFVSNKKLRESIDRDFAELQLAKKASASKTRLILSGGLVEALLLDALERNKDKALKATAAEKDSKGKLKSLDDWTLSTLINVAAELSLISDGSAKLSGVIRDFRNLVHAGKERRGDYVIGSHEAEAAEAGLSAVIRDLQQRARESTHNLE